MNQTMMRTIESLLKKAGQRGMSLRELSLQCHVSPKKRREFSRALHMLCEKGTAFDRGVRYFHRDFIHLREATVTRLNRTFGFARYTDDQTEVFIPGRFFMGALPGDQVLVAPIPARGAGPEGEIVKIVKEGDGRFTGVLMRSGDSWFVRPDRSMRCDFLVNPRQRNGAQEGDKVLCAVCKRGAAHAEHRIQILSSYGDAQTAVHCAQAILDLSGVPLSFPDPALKQAGAIGCRGIREEDLAGRLDLREEILFTIDSSDSKDLDDAVSISRRADGYELGVHIADVSHYVRQGSPLDRAAFERGTSIYFADRVIPMLPKELSNGICSLNPGEDRLAFSCLMEVTEEGELRRFRFEKSVIRSRVKGVYSEINQLLDGSADAFVRQKYEGLTDTLCLLQELAHRLTARKRGRGAPEIETSESKILLDAHSHAIGVEPRARGESERMIEEFMLLANEAAATLARARGIPFVYRVHEPPSPEKLQTLRETLSALGMDTAAIQTGIPASVLARLLEQARGQPVYPIVNLLVLRSMSKAKYFEQPIGHYGLALQNYAQFTSPIRRYPDLVLHRILSDLVEGRKTEQIKARFEAFVPQAARQSTNTELGAMMLERDCEACYKAEYMRDHIGETLAGVVTSVAAHGIYVGLPNTVEGLIKIENLPEGEYELEGLIQLKDNRSQTVYRVGEPITVVCIGADVGSGNIDFALPLPVEEEA